MYPAFQWSSFITRYIGGYGANREDASDRSYRKQPFYCSRATWGLTRAHTLSPIRRFDNYERFEWITFSCLSLITRCQIQSHADIIWLQGRKPISYHAPRHKHKLLCWPADIHSATRSPNTPFSYRLPTTWVVKRRAQGRNLQNEQNGRDLSMRTSIKILYDFC